MMYNYELYTFTVYTLQNNFLINIQIQDVEQVNHLKLSPPINLKKQYINIIIMQPSEHYLLSGPPCRQHCLSDSQCSQLAF